MNGYPTRFRIRSEWWSYGAVFVLALILRLVGAAQAPLNDSEAALALQALALARGQAPLLSPHPLYLALTTLWMAIFSATDWSARFWPALAGSFMALLPLLFRERIGKLPSILLAVFVATDPALLAISRQAGGPSLAVFFTLLAVGLWLRRRILLAGIAAGLALLGGPAVWPGVIGLLAAGWLSGGLRIPSTGPASDQAWPTFSAMRSGLIALLLTLFMAGTLFFFIPGGLSSAGQSLATYLSGWFASAANNGAVGVSIGLFTLGFLLYEFLPLVLGLWRGIRLFNRNDQTVSMQSKALDRFLVLWWLVALLLAVLYPARQLADLAWSLIPLWVLAARQMARLVSLPVYDRLPVAGQAILAAVIFGYVSMGLVTITNVPSNDLRGNWVQLAGALVMLAASAGLVAWGWSRQVAVRGVVWGFGAMLVIYFIAAGWNVSGLAGRDAVELWSDRAGAKDANLILSTLKNLDQWRPQQPNGPRITIAGLSSPSLHWLLRNVAQVTDEPGLSSASSPDIVITPLQPELALASAYRGEAFVLAETINWQQLKPADWFRWLSLRTVPGTALQQEKIIVWARADLFPGGAVQTNPANLIPQK